MTLKLLRQLFFDWAIWGLLAGFALLTDTLARRLFQGSWLPGPLILGLTAALMLVAIPIAHHMEPAEPDQLAHFGYEFSPQRKAP